MRVEHDKNGAPKVEWHRLLNDYEAFRKAVAEHEGHNTRIKSRKVGECEDCQVEWSYEL